MNKIQKTISIPYHGLAFVLRGSSECQAYERRVYLTAILGDGKNVK
ncbi:MAG: hypothetical protein V4471_01945 [Pseudomonadota bacterium]